MKKLIPPVALLFALASPYAAEVDDSISMYVPGEFEFSVEACARCMLGINDCDRKAVSKAIKQLKFKVTPGSNKFDEFAFADWILCTRRKNELLYDPAVREEVLLRAEEAKQKQKLKEKQKKKQEL